MPLKLLLVATLTFFACSNAHAQQWRPLTASQCQPCIQTNGNQPVRIFRANMFQRLSNSQFSNCVPRCSTFNVRPLVYAPQNGGCISHCPPQFSGRSIPGSVTYSWGTPRPLQAAANDCGCNRIVRTEPMIPGTAPQQERMLTDKDGVTLAKRTASLCPEAYMYAANGYFYYSAVECPSGSRANVILIYNAKVAIGCNGAGCNSDPVKPVGQIDLALGTVVTPESVKRIVAESEQDNGSPTPNPAPEK